MGNETIKEELRKKINSRIKKKILKIKGIMIKHANKKIFLGLSWKYVYTLLTLLIFAGILIGIFVYKENSRFEAIKIFISLTSVLMTFIVFLRGFEVFEETQKGNAKDNVNKNFYAMLSNFQSKQEILGRTVATDKEGNPVAINDKSKGIYPYLNIVEYFNEKIIIEDKQISKDSIEELSRIRLSNSMTNQYLRMFFTIINYLNDQFINKVINIQDYKMYIVILSTQLSDNELRLIIYQSCFEKETKQRGYSLLYSGVCDNRNLFDNSLSNFKLLGEHFFSEAKDYATFISCRQDIADFEQKENKQNKFENFMNIIECYSELKMKDEKKSLEKMSIANEMILKIREND